MGQICSNKKSKMNYDKVRSDPNVVRNENELQLYKQLGEDRHPSQIEVDY